QPAKPLQNHCKTIAKPLQKPCPNLVQTLPKPCRRAGKGLHEESHHHDTPYYILLLFGKSLAVVIVRMARGTCLLQASTYSIH
ncbi:MAG: hypothetical protein ACI3YC_07460, partial [Alloprevotella sp.]